MKRSIWMFAGLALGAASLALSAAACGDFEIACYTNENCERGQRCEGGDPVLTLEGTCVEGEGVGGGGSATATSTSARSSTAAGPQVCVSDATCPSGEYCTEQFECAECNTDEHCGASCEPCGGLTGTCVLGVCSL